MNPFRRRSWLLMAAVVASCATLAADTQTPVMTAAEGITPTTVLDRVKALADDRMEGRLIGSRGGHMAASYLAGCFREAGLRGAGSQGSFYQPFEFVRSVTDPESRLTVTMPGRTLDLKGVADFRAFSFCEPPSAESSAPAASRPAAVGPADVVFAGYGITAPLEAYDDYAGLDVKGKIILLLRHEPRCNADGKAFAGARDTDYSTFTTKALNAQEHGAAAVLLVSDPVNHGHEPDALFAEGTVGPFSVDFPIVQIRRDVAEAMLRTAGKDLLAAQQQIERTLKPNSFPLTGVRATLSLGLKRQAARAQNVVAVLPGTDPNLAGEYVMVAAHYDHLGLGHFDYERWGGQVMNGADDNASGTAVLLEVARALRAPAAAPKRSVLFVAFDGEETDNAGSQYYAERPAVPLEKTVAVIDLDMIGRPIKGEVVVTGTGTGRGLADLVRRSAASPVVGLTPRTGGPADLLESDNISFIDVPRLPILCFYGAAHLDYHTPADDWEKIDADGLARIARLVFLITHDLATRPERLVHTPPPPPEQQAFLGVGPDEALPDGVVVAMTVPDSGAERAGLKPGDTILKIDDEDTPGWSGLLRVLSNRRPGDTVRLLVRRGDTLSQMPATLGHRPAPATEPAP